MSLCRQDIERWASDLRRYRCDVSHSPEGSPERIAGEMIASTVSRLLEDVKNGKLDGMRMEVQTFSRQVSDVFTRHPESLFALSEWVRRVRSQFTDTPRLPTK